MKLFKKLKVASLGASALLASYLSEASSLCNVSGSGAQTGCDINQLQSNLSSQLNSAGEIFYAGAAIIGIALVVIGLLKLKAHAMDTQGTSGHLRSAIWLLIIGGLLIAVPVIMLLGSNTITQSTIKLPSESGLFS